MGTGRPSEAYQNDLKREIKKREKAKQLELPFGKPEEEEEEVAEEEKEEEVGEVEDFLAKDDGSVDENLLALETLPDSALEDLAENNGLKVDGRWSRRTLIERMLEANITP